MPGIVLIPSENQRHAIMSSDLAPIDSSSLLPQRAGLPDEHKTQTSIE